jgi:hypothetical protein
MAERFVAVAQRDDNDLVVRTSEPTTEAEEVADAQFIFETVSFLKVVRLFRVDPETLDLIHVQTWTRDEDEVEV